MLKQIFDKISKSDEKYNIEIEVENREIIKKSGLLNYENINLSIYTDGNDYTLTEYLKEEIQLESLIKPIKESNLSPYEKYIAVYNIVKQFKPYQENKKIPEQSRYLRYILNNEYMVCYGYANLLKTLLDKVGISSIQIGTMFEDLSADTSKEKTSSTELIGHERNIIKIDDEKYNIHGIYVVDATWDNDEEKDYYNNASMTFDRKKESKALEILTNEDLLLDFHTIEEFTEKINFYLKRNISKSSESEHLKKIVRAYHQLYLEIMHYLMLLDYEKYSYYLNKYNNQVIEKISVIFPPPKKSEQIQSSLDEIDRLLSILGKYDNITQNNDKIDKNQFREIENLFADFLTEYATYIIPLSNQKISDETLLEAATNVKKEINKYNKEQLDAWKKEVLKEKEETEEKAFPYIYDPNETRLNYLSSKESSSKKR